MYILVTDWMVKDAPQRTTERVGSREYPRCAVEFLVSDLQNYWLSRSKCFKLCLRIVCSLHLPLSNLPPPRPAPPQPFVLVGVVNSVPVSEQTPLEADPDVNQVLQPLGYQSEHDKAEQTCRLDAIAAVWMKCPTIYRRQDKL